MMLIGCIKFQNYSGIIANSVFLPGQSRWNTLKAQLLALSGPFKGIRFQVQKQAVKSLINVLLGIGVVSGTMTEFSVFESLLND
jgi:hypothetical protein